ncbi:MAG: UvrD-helicase domain-containing protein [Spirochaetia bacterium]|nr:UvrD-helicase domain-containing protein [Spirochaetia bacterium]
MNNLNIEVLSASAGTGKTYTLVERFYEALTVDKVRPHAVIATTFTVAAAQELTERTRIKLYKEGKTQLAFEILQSKFGTVNSICDYLVRRYAFYAGVSPQLEVISETEQKLFFKKASSAVLAKYVNKIEAICRRFAFNYGYSSKSNWQDDVNSLVDIIRNNNMPEEDIETGRKRSIQTMLNMLGGTNGISSKEFIKNLIKILDKTIKQVEESHDEEHPKIHELIDNLREFKKILESGYFGYNELHKMGKHQITGGTKLNAKYNPMLEEFNRAASNYRAYQQLHDDIEEYISTIYSSAAECLEGYNDYKMKRGLIDFIDQEVLALKILDHKEVQRDIADNLDLLLVDEFQDTSPLQLEIFLKLSSLAKKSIWVGDPKQSIYGFRDADPRLMAAVVKQFDKKTGQKILSDSWRSRPSLIRFFNRYFSSSFAEEYPEEKVKLKVRRKNAEKNEKEMSEPVTVLHLEGKSNAVFINKLALYIKEIINKKLKVDVKDEGSLRLAKPSDIAVLCRSNDECQKVSEYLAQYGVDSVIARSGLLKTPEGRFFLSALRFVIDANDSLARAELYVLHEGKEKDLEWLKSRLQYINNKPEDSYNETWLDDYSIIKILENLRKRSVDYTVTEMARAVIENTDLRAIAASWPNSSQRQTNIDKLNSYAAEFEDMCLQTNSPATLSAFYLWLQSISNDSDEQGTVYSDNCVNILTYHKSKGLEWPIVFLMSLSNEARNPFWEFSILDERKNINLKNILSERYPMFFPWFMGTKNLKVEWLQSEVEKYGQYDKMVEDSLKEDKRLLYVGMTRARDYCIMPVYKNNISWVERCNEQDEESYLFLNDETIKSLQTEDGEVLISHVSDFEAEPAETIESNTRVWFSKRSGVKEFENYYVQPSQQHEVSGAKAGDIILYSKHLTIKNKPDIDLLGAALHAFLAWDNAEEEKSLRHEKLKTLLKPAGLENSLDLEEVLKQSEEFHEKLKEQFNIVKINKEWPLMMKNKGQLINGIVDMILHTNEGIVIIDHKSSPGPKDKWPEKSVQYAGQLACYKQMLEASLGKKVTGTYINFFVSGGYIEVKV